MPERDDSLGDFKIWSDDSLGDNSNAYLPLDDCSSPSTDGISNEKIKQTHQNQQGFILTLPEKKGFCCKIDATVCKRCEQKRRAPNSLSSSSGSSSMVDSGTHPFDTRIMEDIVDSIMNMKIDNWKPMVC